MDGQESRQDERRQPGDKKQRDVLDQQDVQKRSMSPQHVPDSIGIQTQHVGHRHIGEDEHREVQADQQRPVAFAPMLGDRLPDDQIGDCQAEVQTQSLEPPTRRPEGLDDILAQAGQCACRSGGL
ncbi:hypothetical protein BKG75_14875 [Mycobacteroides chelonae]|nr:hypothetical protein DYE20_03250 [[Mycobacterium] chelonae subsp. gwanakae]OHU16278.1 hypothetical protein BKG75_14875 [Mycobacteroides chelonae]